MLFIDPMITSPPELEHRTKIVNKPQLAEEIDAYLFGGGITVDRYFLVGDLIGHVSAKGREFDLLIEDDLAAACRKRLLELGVSRRCVHR